MQSLLHKVMSVMNLLNRLQRKNDLYQNRTAMVRMENSYL